MSLKDIRPYFRARCEALGLSEHDDPSFQNIPDAKFNKAFHIETAAAELDKQEHLSVNITQKVTLRCFLGAVRNTTLKSDDAWSLADDVIAEVLSPANKLTATGIKNVLGDSIEVSPYSDENDNAYVIKLEFKVLVIVGL